MKIDVPSQKAKFMIQKIHEQAEKNPQLLEKYIDRLQEAIQDMPIWASVYALNEISQAIIHNAPDDFKDEAVEALEVFLWSAFEVAKKTRLEN